MKGQEVIMVGAGGHALSVGEFAGDRIIGYIARELNAEMGKTWLGTDEDIEELISNGMLFHMAFVYSGMPTMKKREQLLAEYEHRGAKFATLISPSAIVTPNSLVGEGCAIMTGAIINRAKLGRNIIVNSGAIIEHDCEIGDNTFIGPGAVVGGFTTIGKNCFIGLGARIGNNIRISDNITVAMGAIVTHDLQEPGIYHGNPLKRFKL